MKFKHHSKFIKYFTLSTVFFNFAEHVANADPGLRYRLIDVLIQTTRAAPDLLPGLENMFAPNSQRGDLVRLYADTRTALRASLRTLNPTARDEAIESNVCNCLAFQFLNTLSDDDAIELQLNAFSDPFPISTPAPNSGSREVPGLLRPSVHIASLPKKPLRALIADDQTLNLKCLANLLKEFGKKYGIEIELVQVNSGEDALHALKTSVSKPFDLAILDKYMAHDKSSGMDGHVVTKHWRAFESENRLDHLPIIAFSASTEPNEIEECERYGMDIFLKKGINGKAKIFAAILQLVSRMPPGGS